MANLCRLRGGSDSHWPPKGTAHRGTPQLPAFCRTRRPTTVVSVTSLRAIHRLLLVVLLFQLSTLLLVIAGPVPPLVSTLAGPVGTPLTAEHQEARKARAALKLSAP